MKIPKFNVTPINPYNANKIKAEQAEKKTQPLTDKLEISAEAKQLSEISSYSVERSERVQQLKEQIEAGTYKVDPEKLAADILTYYNLEKNDESR